MAKGVKGSHNQFCIHGHDTLIFGRNSMGHCKKCRRIDQNRRYHENAEVLRPIRKEEKRLERELFKRVFGTTYRPKKKLVVVSL